MSELPYSTGKDHGTSTGNPSPPRKRPMSDKDPLGRVCNKHPEGPEPFTNHGYYSTCPKCYMQEQGRAGNVGADGSPPPMEHGEGATPGFRSPPSPLSAVEAYLSYHPDTNKDPHVRVLDRARAALPALREAVKWSEVNGKALTGHIAELVEARAALAALTHELGEKDEALAGARAALPALELAVRRVRLWDEARGEPDPHPEGLLPDTQADPWAYTRKAAIQQIRALRAQVAALTEERRIQQGAEEVQLAEIGRQEERIRALTEERDRAEVDASNHAADAETVRRERDEARAEVERLREMERDADRRLADHLDALLSHPSDFDGDATWNPGVKDVFLTPLGHAERAARKALRALREMERVANAKFVDLEEVDALRAAADKLAEAVEADREEYWGTKEPLSMDTVFGASAAALRAYRESGEGE